MKNEKNILATTNKDRHGDKLKLEDLEKLRDVINGDRTVRMGLNHDPLFPPLGQYKNARIEQDKSGEYLLLADSVMFNKTKVISEKEDLVMNYSDQSKPFVEVFTETPESTEIAIDFMSFESKNEIIQFYKEIKNINDKIEITNKVRKAYLPDPEFLITLGKFFILYKLLKPISEKVTEKITDEISKDIAEKYIELKKIIANSIKYLKKRNRPILCIIEIPTEELQLELICRITPENIDSFANSLDIEEIKKVYEKALILKSTLLGEKYQYILDENGEWSLTYLLTEKGEAIGKRKLFEERDRVYKTLLDRGQIFNSIGVSMDVSLEEE